MFFGILFKYPDLEFAKTGRQPGGIRFGIKSWSGRGHVALMDFYNANDKLNIVTAVQARAASPILAPGTEAMRYLCALDSIPDRQARAFPYETEVPGQIHGHGHALTLLVVRWGEQAYGYINSCPHAGVPLEWQEGRFMSLDGYQLQCSTHGALFEISSGLCTWGPCKGQRLRKVELRINAGEIFLLRDP